MSQAARATIDDQDTRVVTAGRRLGCDKFRRKDVVVRSDVVEVSFHVQPYPSSLDGLAGSNLRLAVVTHSNETRLPPPTCRWRVSFCITELDPGGAERQLVRLVTHLDQKVFDPEVICLAGEGALVAPLRAAGVPVTCLKARSRRDIGVILRLRRHLAGSRPDVLQTFLFHANIAGRIAGRLAGVPVVISGIRVAERRRWHLWFDRMTDRLVDRHVCVSRAVAHYTSTVGGLSPEKIVVIPNAVDAVRFSGAVPADLSEFGFPAQAKVVLFVGRLHPQKDPVRLLSAFRRLSARHDDIRLLIVGTGPLEGELKLRSADLGPSVVFAGQREDVPALMKVSACLALPSRWEGMPNVVLEAIAAGVPVVATDVEGISEVLLDGLGTIVLGSRAVDFAAALEEAVYGSSHPFEIRVMSQGIVLKRHKAESIAAEYQRVYVQCLRESGRIGDDPASGLLV